MATEQPRAVRRRDVLVGGGGVALGAVASWAGLRAADALSPFETATPQATYLGGLTEPWQGDHQPGILTAPQGFAGVTAFDLRDGVDRVPVSYTHLRAHETKANLVCRLLLEKKN